MLKTASKPVDVQDLQFKLQCRFKIFGKEEGQLPKSPRSLLAAASRYGLVFVGSTTSTLKAIRFENIEEHSSTDATNIYPRREINLSSQPHFISVNCDDTVLAVIVEKDNCLLGLFYDVLSFYKEEVVVLNEVRLTCTPGLEILQANWHPTINNIFTECKSDGTLGIYELKDKSVDVKKLPAESKACCFCWSPKGKQIAVGSQDGKIIHYKPDLKAVKSIDAPPFEIPHSVLSLQWISNYQFVGVFKVCHGSDPECNVVLIDAPKTGNPVFTNFYDICYSNGNMRPPQFYTINEQHWNILLVASANSMEVGVLSNVGETWTQYILPDSARAELPLDENQDETFPIGITMDTSSVKPVLWGESYIQPAPSLILLSHEGVLCSFRMINLKEGAPSVNSPPDKVNDLSGLKYFTAPVEKAVKIEISQGNQNQREGSLLQKDNSSTPTGVAPAANTNSASMFQSAPTTAGGTAQGSETPTTPLSIFKTQAPMQSSPCLPTNLFGGQISITPVRNKNAQPPTSAALTGTTLLSQISTESASEEVANKGPKPSILKAQAQLQTNLPVNNSTPTSNVSFGTLKTNANTNVFHSTGNISQTTPVKLEEKDSADIKNMLTEMLKMECTALDEEIRDLIIQGQHLKINLNFEEMDKIVHTTEGINEFLKELVETCEIQSSEVHVLKQTTIQSWAWLEEARSRFKESQDEELRNIMKSKPLDSVSEKHRSTLKQMQYYLNSQLAQSHKALDDQWDKFQDYCRKTNRLQLPTMEAIFQTMVKQNAILQKHNYILRDITSQIKGKQKACNDASLFNPSDKKNNLESSFQNLKLEPESIYHIYHQKILNRVKSLPGNKVNQLRRILHNREVPHVMVKSQMSTSNLNSTLKLDQYTGKPATTPNAKKVDFAKQLSQSSPLNSMPAPQISSTPLSAFASTNNVASGGKPQLTSRFGIESQGAQSSSNFKSIKENVAVDKPTNSATSTFFGDKLSGGPQNQNSLLRNLSTNSSKEIGGYSIPKASFNQGSSMLGNKNTSISITTPSVSITSTSSAAVDVVTSAQSNIFKQPSNVPSSSSFESSPANKPFSFISSAPQSNLVTVIPSSLAVSSTSSSKDSLSSTSVISPINKSNASSTFSFAMPKTTMVSSVASSISTTSASSGFATTGFNFGSSSSFSKNSSVPSTQSSLPNTSTIPSTSSTNDGAVSITSSTKFSGMVPKFGSLGTSKEAVPISTTSSVFQTVATTSITSTSNIVGTTSGFFSATSKPSIFNTSASSSAAITTASIFGQSPHKGTSLFSTSTTNGGSLFGTATTSAPVSSTTSQPTFGTSVGITSSTRTATDATVTSSGTSSIFGNAVASTTASSIFFKAATTAGPSATVTKSIFATSPPAGGQAASIFSSTSSSGNSLPISSASIFGTSVSTSGPGSSTLGTSSSSNPVQSHTKAVFGNSFTTVGTTPSTLPTSSTSVPSTSASIFGTSSRADSTAPNLFGTAVSSQAGVPATNISLFGSTVTCSNGMVPPTSTKSIFGAPTTSTATTTSIFGTASAPKSTASIINSQPTFGATTSSSIFGGSSFGTVSTTTATSVFENASTPFTKTPFGSSTSASSPFGTPVATSSFSSTPFIGATSSNSVFGQTTSTASPFSTTSAATSPFGSTTGNVQSQFSAKPTSSDSLFGGTTPAVCSPFGNTQTFGTGFNSNTAAPSSPFGQVNPSPNAFGTATPTENAFGQSSNSSGGMFGAFASSNTKSSEGSFGFGNLNVGNSSQNLFSKTNENKSPFGGGTFNPTTSTGSLFGSSNFGNNNGNSVFGQPTFGSNSSFSSAPQSGPFSAGGGSIAQTGFGISQNSEKTPAFGAAPSFGGSPAFGAAPTFGGAPAFGSTSPFGGTNKIFGSPNSTPAGSVFGSNTQQSSGFGSFGSQNSLGFGNLAQQTNNPGENLTQNGGFGTFASQNTIGFGNLAQKSNNSGQSTPFSGNSSFSSWR
ncbi:nuclear pore complex protein Nup214-like isoform X2 [Coccinella septempunctata]|uniref:nuclear pore complex protein Nup214-like isoform X2 n=1 Tax=Coccinella septempunctata TaxID=41139 RepID=UPI001D077EA8|nr:nuclear pore complex protein Nup214-like isoform X2 [Coccinella septempunctata]